MCRLSTPVIATPPFRRTTTDVASTAIVAAIVVGALMVAYDVGGGADAGAGVDADDALCAPMAHSACLHVPPPY